MNFKRQGYISNKDMLGVWGFIASKCVQSGLFPLRRLYTQSEGEYECTNTETYCIHIRSEWAYKHLQCIHNLKEDMNVRTLKACVYTFAQNGRTNAPNVHTKKVAHWSGGNTYFRHWRGARFLQIKFFNFFFLVNLPPPLIFQKFFSPKFWVYKTA